MASAAKVFWKATGDRPVSKEDALSALDSAAEEYIGADAEFDDELMTETPLSRLVAIAFEANPDEIADLKGEYPCEDGDTGMLWYEGPERRFRERYKFC
jgi:hypothetical protein